MLNIYCRASRMLLSFIIWTGWLLAPIAHAQITLYDNCTAADGGDLVDLNNLGAYPNAIDPSVNIPADLTGVFTNSGVNATPCVTDPIGRDGWVKIRADYTGPLVVSYAPTNALNVALAIYSTENTGGCGTIQDSLLNCVNQGGEWYPRDREL
ncbi:MAG: hypothetical protein HC880_14775 [Bacteroidia bacterium]|nr:hypothetical protein [Bacteroidia bacterium]